MAHWAAGLICPRTAPTPVQQPQALSKGNWRNWGRRHVACGAAEDRQQELLRKAAELRRQQEAVEQQLQALYQGMEELPEAEQAEVLEALGRAAAEELRAQGEAAAATTPAAGGVATGATAGTAAAQGQALVDIPAAVRKGLEQAGAWDEELLTKAATALPRALPPWPDGARHEADEEYVDGDDEHFQVSCSVGDDVVSGAAATQAGWGRHETGENSTGVIYCGSQVGEGVEEFARIIEEGGRLPPQPPEEFLTQPETAEAFVGRIQASIDAYEGVGDRGRGPKQRGSKAAQQGSDPGIPVGFPGENNPWGPHWDPHEEWTGPFHKIPVELEEIRGTVPAPEPPAEVMDQFHRMERVLLVLRRAFLARQPEEWVQSLHSKGLLGEDVVFADPWVLLMGVPDLKRYMRQLGEAGATFELSKAIARCLEYDPTPKWQIIIDAWMHLPIPTWYQRFLWLHPEYHRQWWRYLTVSPQQAEQAQRGAACRAAQQAQHGAQQSGGSEEHEGTPGDEEARKQRQQTYASYGVIDEEEWLLALEDERQQRWQERLERLASLGDAGAAAAGIAQAQHDSGWWAWEPQLAPLLRDLAGESQVQSSSETASPSGAAFPALAAASEADARAAAAAAGAGTAAEAAAALGIKEVLSAWEALEEEEEEVELEVAFCPEGLQAKPFTRFGVPARGSRRSSRSREPSSSSSSSSSSSRTGTPRPGSESVGRVSGPDYSRLEPWLLLKPDWAGTVAASAALTLAALASSSAAAAPSGGGARGSSRSRASSSSSGAGGGGTGIDLRVEDFDDKPLTKAEAERLLRAMLGDKFDAAMAQMPSPEKRAPQSAAEQAQERGAAYKSGKCLTFTLTFGFTLDPDAAQVIGVTSSWGSVKGVVPSAKEAYEIYVAQAGLDPLPPGRHQLRKVLETETTGRC
ncbi:hypothetical protein N2152v2_006540 [Parachlorella kessleri]